MTPILKFYKKTSFLILLLGSDGAVEKLSTYFFGVYKKIGCKNPLSFPMEFSVDVENTIGPIVNCMMGSVLH